MRSILKFGLLAAAMAAPFSPASAERIFGLTGSNNIITFDSATPGTITSSGAIAGVATGDVLTGIDLRPANGTLYSIGTSGAVYAITKNPAGTGYTATSLGDLTTDPSGGAFGIDFNPMVDRLRFVSDTNQNLRINTISPPVTLNDGAITLNGSTVVDLMGVAYRNSRPGATTTALYGLDAASDALVRATNANAGTYTNTSVLGNVFGPLGFSFGTGDRVGFDISGATNQGFFTINDQFFTVNQISGAGALVGGLGEAGVTGITAASIPEPATWAMMIGGFGLIGGALRRSRTRVVAAA